MNTDTLIKLTNPLSDKPTEMWMQAIADFEEILTTPGYEISMGHWYKPSLDEPCMVCMAGASMAQRTGGLVRRVSPNDYSEEDGRKFESINRMREGEFKHALNWLALPEKEAAKWLDAIQAADLEGLESLLYIVYIKEDWRGLIKLLREAIARINTEYERLSK